MTSISMKLSVFVCSLMLIERYTFLLAHFRYQLAGFNPWSSLQCNSNPQCINHRGLVVDSVWTRATGDISSCCGPLVYGEERSYNLFVHSFTGNMQLLCNLVIFGLCALYLYYLLLLFVFMHHWKVKFQLCLSLAVCCT